MKKSLIITFITAAIMATGQINAQLSADNIVEEQTSIDKYQEIKIGQLPRAVIKAVKTSFERAVIGKAFVNEDGHYKLLLQIDGMEKTVYANAKGEWIKPNK